MTVEHRHQIDTFNVPLLCRCGWEWVVDKEVWRATKAGEGRRAAWTEETAE